MVEDGRGPHFRGSGWHGPPRLAWIVVLLGLGCTSGVNTPMRATAATLASQSGSGGTGDEGGTNTTSGTTSSSSATATTSSSSDNGTQGSGDPESTDSSGGTSGSTTDNPELCESILIDSSCDTPGVWSGAGACNPYDPLSCGAGSKCGPFSFDDDGNQLAATSCGSIPATPATLGQPCTLELTPLVWTDSCAQGLWCEGDPKGTTGICVEMCGCGPGDPTCPNGQLCQGSDLFDGLNLCRVACDPLAPNCPAGEGCYPVPAGGGTYEWMCLAAGTLPVGSACPGFNCDASTVCSQSACWQTCNLDAPATCAGACMPYTPPPEDPVLLLPATACFDNVGICVM